MRTAKLFLILALIYSLNPMFLSASLAAQSQDDFLTIKLQKPALKEQIQKQEIDYIKNLPGGIYHAPAFYTQVKSILNDFKRTGRISDDIILKVHFSSESSVNAMVVYSGSLKPAITEVKIYYVSVTKGLLELISQPELYQAALGEELVAKIKSRSKSLLAYVLGHELGHVMHGDTEKTSVTTRVYQELAADDFGLRIMTEAGYDPEGVIDALEMLSKLYVNKSFAQKVASAMDVHPKPWFRIAALAELIDQLKSSPAARKEMGININGEYAVDRSTQKLEARGDEHTSRTSVEVVKRLVNSEVYKGLSNREKERQLEDLLTKVKSTSANLVTSRGVVATVNAYAEILAQVKTLEDIDDLIGSLNRFKEKMGTMASMPGRDVESNAKVAFRNIKAAITEAQISIIKAEKSFTFATKTAAILAQLEEISDVVDKKYTMGVLFKMVLDCTDITELAKILEFYIHRSFQFKIRFTDESNYFFTELGNKFLAKLARRHLHLVQNLEKTMDFIETAVPLSNSSNKPTIQAVSPIMAELALEVIENPQIIFGQFIERIKNPKTATDKIFAETLISSQNNNAFYFVKNREKSPNANANSVSNIHHLQSGRNVSQITLTKEQASFFLLALGETSGQALLTSLTQNKYSTQEVVALLIERSKQSKDYWQQYQVYLTQPQVKQFASGPMQFQIKSLQSRILLQKLFEEETSNSPEIMRLKLSLADFLARLVKEGRYSSLWQEIAEEMKNTPAYNDNSQIHEVNKLRQFVIDYYSERGFALISRLEASLQQIPEAYADLLDLKQNAEKIIAARVSQNITNITTNVTMAEKTPEEKVVAKNLMPILTTKHLEALSVDGKVNLFAQILEADEQKRILQFGPGVRAELENIKISFELAVKQREVDESVKTNFLNLLEKMVNLAVPTMQGATSFIPTEYFVLRRELRTYFDALRVSKSKIDDLFNTNSLKNLAGLLDSNLPENSTNKYGHRMSFVTSAAALIKSFITPTQKITNEILEGNNAPALLQFAKLAEEFALKIAYYEGIDNEELKTKDLVGYYRAKQALSLDNALYDENDRAYLPYASKAYADFFQFKQDSDLGKILKGSLDKKMTDPGLVNFYKSLIEERWSVFLYRFGATNDPVEAMLTSSLMFELWNDTEASANDVNDANARFTLLAWSKALALVKEKADMEAVTFLLVQFSKKLKLADIVTDFLTTDLSKMFSVYTIKYREKFFNTFIKKVAQYDGWQGQTPNPRMRLKLFVSKILSSTESMLRIAHKVQSIAKYISYMIIKIMPDMHNSIFEPIYFKLAKININLLSKDIDQDYFGRTNHLEVFEQIRKQTPWSLDVDTAIYSFIQSPNFAGKNLTQGKRDYLVKMVKSIRSLRVREQAYTYLLQEYGDIQIGLGQKISTAIKLIQAYIKAKNIWGAQVIQDLKRADNLFERLKIIETAWETEVAERAQHRGISKTDAINILMELKGLAGKFNLPVETEIENMFPEASRHRDEFLDKVTKKKAMTVEDLTLVENMKSRNSETPYHLASKVMLELMDEYADVLTPLQRSKFILYMSGIDANIDPTIEKIITERFFATKHRSESAKAKGLKFKLKEIRDFVIETHPEERLVAYRALFLKGISGNKEAEELLINKLLFADPNMPEYLRKVLNIYLNVLKPTELSTRLMWLMANNAKGQSLAGPELLKLLIEYGGVTEKKMAQLIASHGFNLPREYQVVLEVFKGNAQKISKMAFIQLVKERLPADKFAQIESFDKELGSGSMKVGYLVTLKDGRQVVVMATQEMVFEKTVREFEIARAVIKAIQADPDLRVDNLEILEQEMERIIKTEMKFLREAKMMKQHKVSYDARPWLVRRFGNLTDISIPQPMLDWSSENLLFEEFVKSKKFSQLKPTSMIGWSQKDMAKASITEVLNQLLMYMDAPGGVVILDIDPHEENQLAEQTLIGTKKTMVNIDLGQSVLIEPEVVRGLVKAILLVATKRTAEAFQVLEKYVNFQNDEQRKIFWEIFYANQSKYKDPVEALTQTLEKVELKGIMLKPEFLYFQKLFATLVGLKRHINDEYYIVKQVSKLFALRLLGSPIEVKNELVELLKKTPQDEKNLAITRQTKQDLSLPVVIMCKDLSF